MATREEAWGIKREEPPLTDTENQEETKNAENPLDQEERTNAEEPLPGSSKKSSPRNKRKRKARGRKCKNCHKFYNTNCIPPNCECGTNMGGKFVPKEKNENDVVQIVDEIYSVRLNKQGINKRVFVENGVCSSEICRKGFKSLSIEKRKDHMCPHMKMIHESNYARAEKKSRTVSEEDLKARGIQETERNLILDGKTEVEMNCFINIPGKQFVAPSFGYVDTSYVHLSESDKSSGNLQCSVPKCNKKPTQRQLIQSWRPMCIHKQYLRIVTNEVKLSEPKAKPKASIDRKKTVGIIVNKIKSKFPEMHESDKIKATLYTCRQEGKLLGKETDFQNYLPVNCSICQEELKDNLTKTDSAFIVTVGSVKKISPLPSKLCKNCNIVEYPDLTNQGFVVIGTKFVIGFDVVCDLRDTQKVGAPLIKSIELKLKLWSSCEGEELEKNVVNFSKQIEKMTLAVQSLLITGNSLDSVCCLICGSIYKTCNFDGNAKDTLPVDSKYMIYDKEDPSPIYSLPDFIHMLASFLVESATFQNVTPPTINMLKLPLVINPAALGTQVNSENVKVKKFNKDKDEMMKGIKFNEFVRLVMDEELKMSEIGGKTQEELRSIAKEIGVKGASNLTGTKIVDILTRLHSDLSAGASGCHKYTSTRARTAGFEDGWCEHGSKICSKLLSLQESPRDVVDCLKSLKVLPTTTMCDDPCNVVNQFFIHYPLEAKIIFGDRKGCFQAPSSTEAPPEEKISCPDISPLGEFPKVPTEVVLGPYVHPDTLNVFRYILGTRLQIQKKISHKRIECAYHNVDLAIEGAKLNTMMQEAKQVVRKYTRVKNDRLRSLPVGFLGNYVMDFFQNEDIYNKQLSDLGKSVTVNGRDPETLRAITSPK